MTGRTTRDGLHKPTPSAVGRVNLIKLPGPGKMGKSGQLRSGLTPIWVGRGRKPVDLSDWYGPSAGSRIRRLRKIVWLNGGTGLGKTDGSAKLHSLRLTRTRAKVQSRSPVRSAILSSLLHTLDLRADFPDRLAWLTSAVGYGLPRRPLADAGRELIRQGRWSGPTAAGGRP